MNKLFNLLKEAYITEQLFKSTLSKALSIIKNDRETFTDEAILNILQEIGMSKAHSKRELKRIRILTEDYQGLY